jgi:hypothetical protein
VPLDGLSVSSSLQAMAASPTSSAELTSQDIRVATRKEVCCMTIDTSADDASSPESVRAMSASRTNYDRAPRAFR